jgi:hypothetical protein
MVVPVEAVPREQPEETVILHRHLLMVAMAHLPILNREEMAGVVL